MLAVAVVLFASIGAGWAARAAIANAREAVSDEKLAAATAEIRALRGDAQRATFAAKGVLDAAERRASIDTVADPLGVGLLLGGAIDGPSIASGEAEPDGDSGDSEGSDGPSA